MKITATSRAIFALVLMILALATFAYTNSRPKGDSQGWYLFQCSMMSEPSGKGGEALRTPEMKRLIAEIDASIPLNTVSSWSDKDVQAASDYLKKVIQKH